MPNRVLKESICYNDKIAALSWFDEVVFYRLMVNCDDYGRLDARPDFLRSRCFCLQHRVTAAQLTAALERLEKADLVLLYRVSDKPYLLLTGWAEHQKVKQRRARFPGPDLGQTLSDGHTRLNPIQSESESESESQSEPGLLSAADLGKSGFDLFWQAYPLHIRKDRAKLAYRAAVDVPVQVLVEALEKQKQSVQWTKNEGEYIPYPANWLKNRGWEDDLPAAIPKGASGELGQAELEAIGRVLRKKENRYA